MAAGYTVDTTVDVALTAATAKTILSVINGSNSLIRLCAIAVSFDGISAVAEPVTIELCKSTQGAAGTTTSQTPVQVRGPTRTVVATGARNYTAEPTTLTAVMRWLVHPQTGLFLQFPLGREPEQIASGNAYCLRVTAPATVNCQGFIEFEEG